jgi:hypothetical protein
MFGLLPMSDHDKDGEILAPRTRREPGSAQDRAPSPAEVARRRQVAVLQRRRLVYAPDLDGRADPGEVVWTWVAFQDDPHQGKDHVLRGRR